LTTQWFEGTAYISFSSLLSADPQLARLLLESQMLHELKE